MHSLQLSVLKILAYFDVFSYPLTSYEILFFLDQPTTEDELAVVLDTLLKSRMIYQFNNFFSLANDAAIGRRRMSANKLAVKHIKRAKRVAQFLYLLPYVRGI